MTESTHKEDRSPLYNHLKATWRTAESHRKDDKKPPGGRQKAIARTTESHHAAIKNKLRDGLHRAALFTFYFSLFVPDWDNFSLSQA